jgi:hypothetical protein
MSNSACDHVPSGASIYPLTVRQDMARVTETVDFSPFYLNAREHLKQIYEAANNKKYEDALLIVNELVADVRQLQIALLSYTEK